MTITDEAVALALKHWCSDLYEDAETAMRAALEAALCAKSGSAAEIIDDLMSLSHPMAESMPDGMRLTALIQIANRAAACIEDLSDTLIHVVTMDAYTRDGEEPAHEIMRACTRATLERWGLK